MYSASAYFPSYGRKEESLGNATIVQEVLKHDIAVYEVPNTRLRFYRTGTPISLSWARGNRVAAFHGYVHHIEPGTLENQTMRVWCKAASTALENGARYTYRHRTASQLVAEIGRAMGFNAVVEHHPRVIDRFSLTGGRVWDSLVELAKDVGWALYVRNTTIFFHPRLHRVQFEASAAPVLQHGALSDGANMPTFSPSVGAAQVGHERTERVITAIDPRTGYQFSMTGGVVRGELGYLTHLPAGKRYQDFGTMSPGDARWKLHAMAENERFHITATATAFGLPGLTPMSPVQLAGVDDEYEGLWVVTKVSHRLLGAEYFMDLELGRDALGTTGRPSAGRAVRPLRPLHNPQPRLRVVEAPSRLVNDQWRAQWTAASRVFYERPRRARR